MRQSCQCQCGQQCQGADNAEAKANKTDQANDEADVNEADNANEPKNQRHQDEAKVAKTANNPTICQS